jgi:hypothetical protein
MQDNKQGNEAVTIDPQQPKELDIFNQDENLYHILQMIAVHFPRSSSFLSPFHSRYG